MQKEQDVKSAYFMSLVFGIIIMLLNVYYFCYPTFAEMGLGSRYMADAFTVLATVLFNGTLYSKSIALLLGFAPFIVKSGKTTKMTWTTLGIMLGVSLIFYFVPFRTDAMYIFGTVIGYFVAIIAFGNLMRKIYLGLNPPLDDEDETFEQCEELMENKYSVNIPTEYVWQGKRRKGWINVVNPFRATMVLGTPGSGKSFSVYKPFISQLITKRGFTVFCYDFKFPDLTEEVYNEYMTVRDNKKIYKHRPEFCIINFDSPRYSLRCNPIHPRYIQDAADTAEIAEIIFRNVNGDSGGGDKFFTDSAKMFVDCCVLRLRNYKNGKFCTFPHLIEMLNYNYQDTFKVLQRDPKVWAKLVPFRSALEGKAMDQLMGQVASAQIPLNRFNAESLYWVMSGDDFSLDFNEPLRPKIICVGNNPDKQSIYGTALSIFTARIFRLANRKHKLPSALLLDELPTMQVKDLDSTIATARSNLVAILWAAQDKTQLKKYFGDKEALNIFNIIGNWFFGSVSGETAKDFSDAFGTRIRKEQSQSESESGESISTSWREKQILPRWKIETLSQGVFAGKVADEFGQEIKKKFFCAKIIIDLKELAEKKKRWKKIPVQTDFDDEATAEEVKKNADKYIWDYLTNRFFLKALRQEREYSEDFVDKYFNELTADVPLVEPGEEENAESLARDAAKVYYEELVQKNDKKSLDYLLGETIRWQLDEEVRKAVSENFFRIREDIKGMMESELKLIKEEEEEKKAQEKERALQAAAVAAAKSIIDERSQLNKPPYVDDVDDLDV